MPSVSVLGGITPSVRVLATQCVITSHAPNTVVHAIEHDAAPHLIRPFLDRSRHSARSFLDRSDLLLKRGNLPPSCVERDHAFAQPITERARTVLLAPRAWLQPDTHVLMTVHSCVHYLLRIPTAMRPTVLHTATHARPCIVTVVSPITAIRWPSDTDHRRNHIVRPSLPSRVDPEPSSRSHHAASHPSRTIGRPVTWSRDTHPQPLGGPATTAL
jgi:hypothetical protein